jgi:hypothetical protein
MQQKAHSSFQFPQRLSAVMHSTQLCTTSQIFFCCIGIRHAPNYSFGNRYLGSNKNNVSKPLDLTSISTMLDVPAPSMLDVPARQSPTLDLLAHLAHIIRSNSPPPWTLDCIISGPSNPHDPGPSATVDPGRLQSNLILDAPAQMLVEPIYPVHSIRSISLLLWTLDFIAHGPSNPHDPGPSITVDNDIATSYFHLILFIITIYELIDFLCTPPRSPSSAHVRFCMLFL